MSYLDELPNKILQFYTTAPYRCSYLSDKMARSKVATPSHIIDKKIYSDLIKKGFRRSGAFVYKTACVKCNECVPVRINTFQFKLSRSFKRVLNLNKNMNVSISELSYYPEHYSLYLNYQSVRHKGGGMDTDSIDQYKHFLLQSNVSTRLIEFKCGGILKMVSIFDQLDDGISAVYTFYDPKEKKNSLGVFNILWQIELCKFLNLKYLYLGYWIDNCKKMSYKSRFKPMEGLKEKKWNKIFY